MPDEVNSRRFLPPWTVDETEACFIVRGNMGRALALHRTVGSGRQFGLRKTVGNPLDVFFVLERLPSEMLAEGVF